MKSRRGVPSTPRSVALAVGREIERQGAQKHRAHARSETAQKMAAGLRLQQGKPFFRMHGYRLFRG